MLALFSRHGLCLKRLKFSTNSDPRAYAESLSKQLRSFVSSRTVRRHIRAITVAIPGVVKCESNSYSFKFGNLDWPDIDLATPIKNLFKCKLFFINDASLATLYEANRLGVKAGKSVYLTFSTGIGGGVAQDGKLLEASALFEPGHVKYKFQGRSLEWEDIASAKAIISAYHCSSVQDIVFDDTSIKDLVARLSFGLLDIIKNEKPDTIIIGGPVGLIFDTLHQPLLDNLRTKAKIKKTFSLRKAHRPTESVIYGAYLYSKQNYHK